MTFKEIYNKNNYNTHIYDLHNPITSLEGIEYYKDIIYLDIRSEYLNDLSGLEKANINVISLNIVNINKNHLYNILKKSNIMSLCLHEFTEKDKIKQFVFCDKEYHLNKLRNEIINTYYENQTSV